MFWNSDNQSNTGLIFSGQGGNSFSLSWIFSGNFTKILRQIMPINPQAAVGLAKMVTNRDQGPPKANID